MLKLFSLLQRHFAAPMRSGSLSIVCAFLLKLSLPAAYQRRVRHYGPREALSASLG